MLTKILTIVTLVSAMFTGGWTAAVEFRYLPLKDIHAQTLSELALERERLKQLKDNLHQSPEHIKLKHELRVSQAQLEKYKKLILEQDTEITRLQGRCSIMGEIGELQAEKRKVDEKMRCETENCMFIGNHKKETNFETLAVYRKQSDDLLTQIKALTDVMKSCPN